MYVGESPAVRTEVLLESCQGKLSGLCSSVYAESPKGLAYFALLRANSSERTGVVVRHEQYWDSKYTTYSRPAEDATTTTIVFRSKQH
jgi:hypothetical protein